ncbi:MAG: hypothetical protein IKN06_13965 [Bacteroidales bacterium]|nr:hypothetical protein [Bacteroidales bacterium]
MRTLRVPFIADFEEVDLDTALELEGARFQVDQVNWPATYPYAPLCAGRIARTEESLIVDFRVSGLDLRAQNTEDNGKQWEDSCVEFFVENPDGSEYYNFEVNPLGKVLAAKGAGRENRVKRPAEEMAQILRTARYEGAQDFQGGIWDWRVTLIVPFELLGVDLENLPEKLRANFYKCGDETAHPHFLSWSPIGTASPDFHRPEYFGELILR